MSAIGSQPDPKNAGMNSASVHQIELLNGSAHVYRVHCQAK